MREIFKDLWDVFYPSDNTCLVAAFSIRKRLCCKVSIEQVLGKESSSPSVAGRVRA